MTSEIRTNSLKSRAGLSTVTMTDSGPMFSGITTFVDNSGFTFGVGGGTSIFTPATNVLTFGTNNTEKIRIDASGHMHGVGVITATHFYGDGSNLTGITGTTINNYASTRIVTATNNANELDAETNLTVNGSLITFAESTLVVDKGTNPTISTKETAGNKEVQLRANTTGGLLRTVGSYPLVFGIAQVEKIRLDTSGRLLIGTTSTNQNISKIVVKASSPSDTYDNHIYLEGSETSGDANTGGVLGFGGHDGGGSFRNWANIWGVKENSTDGNTASYMAFHTRAAGGNPAEKVRIDSSGRVQINQTTNLAGTAKLEVMGTGDNTYPMYSYAIGVCDTQAYNVSNGTGMGIGFSYKHNSAGATALGCGIRGFKENTTDGDYAGAMAFYTRANGAGAGERLRINSNGIVTKPYQYVFMVSTTNHSKTASWGQITNMGIVQAQCTGVSDGTYWSNSTQRFTAPVTGVYYFYVGGWSYGNSNGSRYAYAFRHTNNNGFQFIGGGDYCSGDSPMAGWSRNIKLSAGEWVELWGYSAISVRWGGGHHFFWGGYLLG